MSLVLVKMPFGKYQGTLIADLPVAYLEWFGRKGFPQGKIGRQLELCLEIKQNGLDQLLRDLKKAGRS